LPKIDDNIREYMTPEKQIYEDGVLEEYFEKCKEIFKLEVV
jgi:hypothetical protein